MIRSLSIKNLALIEEATLEFSEGLNILTGETGAGKTVVVSALDLVLGGRSDADKIRKGARQLELEAAFSLPQDSPALAILEESGLADDVDTLEMVVRRVVTSDGKSKCWINGHFCNTSTLMKVGEYLVDIHGQHEHQRLLKPGNHLEYLDRFGGKEHLARVSEYREIYSQYQDLKRKLEQTKLSESERLQQIDLLTMQIDEIEKANPRENELDHLLEQKRKAQHAEELFSQVGEALKLISNEADQGCSDLAGKAIALLDRAVLLDPKLAHQVEELEETRARLDEVAYDLKGYLMELQFEPGYLEEIESRIYTLKNLHNKYGAGYQEIMNFLDGAKAKLVELENHQSIMGKLQKELESKEKELGEKSKRVSAERKKIAESLAIEVNRELSEMNMGGVTFRVLVEKTSELSENGGDLVEFQISPGKGEPFRPMNKIASGGELSRIMLALKIVLAKADQIDSLVFDEVDAGIGGPTAKVIGKKLSQLSRFHQVLNVTHLPQIAAFANAHFLVSKMESPDRVVTKVELLLGQLRKEELARMLGGGSETAVKHAEELIQEAEIFR